MFEEWKLKQLQKKMEKKKAEYIDAANRFAYAFNVMQKRTAIANSLMQQNNSPVPTNPEPAATPAPQQRELTDAEKKLWLEEQLILIKQKETAARAAQGKCSGDYSTHNFPNSKPKTKCTWCHKEVREVAQELKHQGRLEI